MRPLHVDEAEVAFGDHQFFLVNAPLGHDLAAGIAHEALPPELDPAAGVPLMSHAVRRGDAALTRLEGEWCLRFVAA